MPPAWRRVGARGIASGKGKKLHTLCLADAEGRGTMSSPLGPENDPPIFADRLT
jgi:hypothetical protein